MKNVYVTGADGYLGKAFVKAGYLPLICNVLEANSIERSLDRCKPDAVFHLAGKSDPDWCEENHRQAGEVNVRGTNHVACACYQRGIPFVYLSSSQIWGGGWWERLWNKHTETSKYTPAVNSYGMQKVAAEFCTLDWNNDGWQNSKVVRTSHIFSHSRFSTELHDLAHGHPIDAPTFLKRSFIHVDHFIKIMNEYFKWFYNMPHTLHIAGSETVSYYDFWLEVASQFDFDPNLVRGRRIEKDVLDGQVKARRPRNGGLDTSLSRSLGLPSFNYVQGIERMKHEG